MSEISIGQKSQDVYDQVYGIDHIRRWINTVFRRKSRSAPTKHRGNPDNSAEGQAEQGKRP